jgi:hypothetical protein
MRVTLAAMGLAIATSVPTTIPATPSLAASMGDPVCGDINSSGKVTASDALLVLQNAVGQSVELECPPAALILKSGQTVSYVGDDDGELQLGVAHALIDNGDGTVSDSKTGLMWEKHDDSNLPGLAGIHDRNNKYTWANAFVKIADLNFVAFAGYTDWRLPNRKELDTIVDLGAVNPATFPAFNHSCTPGCTLDACSCTQADYFWSSTTYLDDPTFAWGEDFGSGYAGAVPKTFTPYVRAVRNGP